MTSPEVAVVLQPEWHARLAEDVLVDLGSTPDGLGRDEAARRGERVGPNRLEPPERDGLLGELLESLTEPLQLLLVVVAVLSGIWGELRDAIAIGAVILVVASIETISEVRARRALDALADLTRPEARIVSDGVLQTVASADLVPGDVLALEAGDQVPADARLFEIHSLRVDESTLSGEPIPADKATAPTPSDAPLAERTSMVYAGTGVVAGSGRAVVTATGPRTELGQLGALASGASAPDTPMQQAMGQLARTILLAAIAASVLVPAIGLMRGLPMQDMVLAGLALAFATVPEELPVLVTVLLAVGGRRLAKRHVLLRRLRAGEAIGEVTIVVTDKTGTLTHNRLRVESLVGATDQVLAAALASVPADQRRVDAPVDPLLAAIVLAAAEAGVDVSGEDVGSFPFDAERKRASRVLRHDGSYRVVVLGAPEAVVAACRDTGNISDALDEAARMGRDGLRVVAVARRDTDQMPETSGDAERDLTLVGLVGFLDPIRDGVTDAVADLFRAGIATMVVTGDLAETAIAVAAAAGLPRGELLQGGQALAELDDAELAARLGHGTVVARATPADKLRIVRVLQDRGERVAVTGDGVNDAPALAAADVGVAMGQRGTDLAREAADLILTDDAYPTLADAVAGGRALASQLRRAVGFYLGVKLAVVVVIGLPVALGLGVPLEPVHIIILELFMDLGASLAFVSEPIDPAAMQRPPRDPARRFLDRAEIGLILSVAATLPLGVAGSLLVTHALLGTQLLPTVTLTTWLIAHTAVAWSLRADPRLPWRDNPAFPAWTLTAIIAAVLLAATPLGALVRLPTATPAAWAIILTAAAVTTATALLARRLLGHATS